MNKTFIPTTNFIKKKWYIIDVKNQILGRIASQISAYLLGKNRITYTPFLSSKINIIIINFEKIIISGHKITKITKKTYSNFSKNSKTVHFKSYLQLFKKSPQKIFEHAIKGMLPKNKLYKKF